MDRPKISEEEREEIHTALLERKEKLDKLREKAEDAKVPGAAEAYDKILALYIDTGEGAGLTRLFAYQPDMRDESRYGEERDANGGQDLFGGGAETGGAQALGTIWPEGTPARRPAIGDMVTPIAGGETRIVRLHAYLGSKLYDPTPTAAESMLQTGDVFEVGVDGIFDRALAVAGHPTIANRWLEVAIAPQGDPETDPASAGAKLLAAGNASEVTDAEVLDDDAEEPGASSDAGEPAATE
ncbi:MAG TPA: hypothetical protein VFN38_10490 [Gemmatimonadaceae bacterium]|nr:hypothetical protein [Gemmatimonadaceae bacterium]